MQGPRAPALKSGCVTVTQTSRELLRQGRVVGTVRPRSFDSLTTADDDLAEHESLLSRAHGHVRPSESSGQSLSSSLRVGLVEDG
jgi:hypothetical protein